ncbi:MAG: putative DNA binding domain-containing protein [Desulfitobacteriaceae bacterium]|nr:putative DNA binding domain-containing protein [Desulfitobacteriaceae bacterium]
MNHLELERLLDELRALPYETEWVEFKQDRYDPQEIGEYISALSNSACLHGKDLAYLIFGIDDADHSIKGTSFNPQIAKKNNQELENWWATQLNPRVDFKILTLNIQNKNVVIFSIDPAKERPVAFRGIEYIRVGSNKHKLKDFPEKERKIWRQDRQYDWSAQICAGATIDDLNTEAIARARIEYKNKNLRLASDVDAWDDRTFLNKARLTIKDQITRSAILLLGKEESEHFISPAVAKITWVLKNDQGTEKDYQHFGPPFLLKTDEVYSKIRNLNYRYLPDNSLFPTEIKQYEPYLIRETLHNCIAHQDYELGGRINVVERSDELLFTNLGNFLPGSVENVIATDAPPEKYRNPFLANAMVNLNMIDTIGSGIRKMFNLQRQRFFPLPDYDLSETNRVKVRILGKIIDENYTRLLIKRPDLDLKTIMDLDKVQKGIPLAAHDIKKLRSLKLIEGSKPKIYISAQIASLTDSKSDYIKNRAFDDEYYKDLIISYLKKYEMASRKDIDDLLLDKLSSALDQKQKRNKVRNLLYTMSKKEGTIQNNGTSRNPIWVLKGR